MRDLRVHVRSPIVRWLAPVSQHSSSATRPMLAVAAAATTATVYLKEDFSGDCARLPLEPGVRCHRVSKPVLPWQGRAAGL